MRDILDSFGIDVSLSQAQEVTAAFFGAQNWSQLVRLQNLPTKHVEPSRVYITRNGHSRDLFFHTPEEAIWCCARELRLFDKALQVTLLSDGMGNMSPRVELCVALDEDCRSGSVHPYFNASVIELTATHAKSNQDDSEFAVPSALMNSVDGLLASVASGSGKHVATTSGILYRGTDRKQAAGLMFERLGIPPSRVFVLDFCAAAIDYETDERDAPHKTKAYLHVAHFEEGKCTLAEPIPLHRALCTVDLTNDGYLLTVEANYGRGYSVALAISDRQALERLLDAAYAPIAYSTSERPSIPPALTVV
ncbi:MAG: hypothetical protein ING75_15185 [Rhodocyclaceae bacterium]|nr:hypothetical protein [Rhodocyclaceae bacterium]